MSNHRFFLYFHTMNLFDQFYISVYQIVKKYKPKLAAKLARLYVSLIQIGLFLLLGVFFMKFCEQMKLTFLTPPNAGCYLWESRCLLCLKIGWVTMVRNVLSCFPKHQSALLNILFLRFLFFNS